jgi:hypothetical protein
MIEYLNNKEIAQMFETDFFHAKKIEPTVGRLPQEEEVGTMLVTWAKDEKEDIKAECRNIIESHHVIAYNPHSIGFLNHQMVYREWLVDMETWMKNYGIKPTLEERTYFHKDVVKCIKITSRVLEILGSKNGISSHISCYWNEHGMKIFLNGYLTNRGYGISPKEFERTYLIVD